MAVDVRTEGIRNLAAIQSTNRGLVERALHMRAVSYLAQQKASLLTQTIFEIDRSKEHLREHSRVLAEKQETIRQQKSDLEARTAALEEIRRTLEDRVRQRTRELEGANAALRESAAERQILNAKFLRAQKHEVLGRLAGGVAHDFNNLLTIILGSTQLALIEGDRGETQKLLGDAIDACARGAALTRQMLSFAGRQVQAPVVIAPAAVVNEFAQLLRRSLGEAVTLQLDVDPDAGNVLAAVTGLEQVLLNLVVNARDAMPKGGTILVAVRRVERALNGSPPHGACVELQVTDTGEGMSPEVVAHVFEPFFTTKAPGVGTGLGLATVEAIVRECNGFVSVESRVGGGTTFRVHLPLVVAASDVDPSARPSLSTPRGTESVLVVDDDLSVLDVVRRMLQTLGYHVLCAESVAVATEILVRERIDLLLLDSVMPCGSREDFEGVVMQRWPDTRIVLMSGYADRARVLDAAGRPLPFLEKPIEFARLATAVRMELDRAAAPARR